MAILIFETGPRKGEQITLDLDTVYTIGRDESAHVQLEDELSSRVHAKVRGKDGRFYLKDVESSNGTLVNDDRIDLHELSDGDKITIGTTILSFLSEKAEATGGGRTLGGYKLQDRLGRGGMGTVFRALQLSLSREVALKILSPELSQDPTFVERFLKEAQSAGQLNHPNIVQVYDVDQADGLIFYAMEYVPGGTIEDRLNRDGALSVGEALKFLLDAARGLQYAEFKKIVHRDIKPDNLMLTEIGTVKIADLGLALASHDGESKGMGILGTPHFISPEQARGETLDTRSDLYSLGATFFRMLTGSTMFHGTSAQEIIRKQVREEPPSIREKSSAVPEAVAAIYRKLVQKTREDRFQNPSELITAIEAAQAGRTSKGKFVALAVALIAAVFLVIKLTDSGDPRTDPNAVTSPDFADNEERSKVTAQMEAQARKLALEKEEVEAMRSRVDLDDREDQMTREEYIEALKLVAKTYPETGEASKATAKAREVQGTIDEEARQAVSRANAVAKALAVMETAVQVALENQKYAEAVTVILSQGNVDESIAENPSIKAAASRLGDQINKHAGETVARQISLATSASDKMSFEEAGKVLATAEESLAGHMGLPPEAAKWSSHLSALSTSLADQRQKLVEAEKSYSETLVAADLQQTLGEFDWKSFHSDIRNYEFQKAIQSLESLNEKLQTAPFRTAIQRRLEDTRAAGRLLSSFEEAVRSQNLKSDRVQHPDRTAKATISGLSPEGNGIMITVRKGAGTASSVLRYPAFSTVYDFVELLGDRASEKQPAASDLLRGALAFASSEIQPRLDDLASQIRKYDRNVGWSNTQRESIATWSLPRLEGEELLALINNKTSGEMGLDDIIRRLDREVEARRIFEEAMNPFCRDNPEVHFEGSVSRFEHLVREYPDTDFFLNAYPILDGGQLKLSIAR